MIFSHQIFCRCGLGFKVPVWFLTRGWHLVLWNVCLGQWKSSTWRWWPNEFQSCWTLCEEIVDLLVVWWWYLTMVDDGWWCLMLGDDVWWWLMVVVVDVWCFTKGRDVDIVDPYHSLHLCVRNKLKSYVCVCVGIRYWQDVRWSFDCFPCCHNTKGTHSWKQQNQLLTFNGHLLLMEEILHHLRCIKPCK